MAYRKKSHAILSHKPDLLILQECSKTDIETSNALFKHWVGSNPNKGLGVLGFSDCNFQVADNYDDSLHWVIPIHSNEINVLAIWAHRYPSKTYIEGMVDALHHYDSMLRADNTLFIGDMNNNVMWDGTNKPELQWANYLKELESRGKHSVWHAKSNDDHGEESVSTLFMYRQPERGYHIDYVFASKMLIEQSTIEIGAHEDWLAHSDHVPIMLEIKS